MEVYQYATGRAVGEGYGFFHESQKLPPMGLEYRKCRTGLTLNGTAFEMYQLKDGRGIVIRTEGDRWFYSHALVGVKPQSSDELLMLMKQDCFLSSSAFLALEEKRKKGEYMPVLNLDPIFPSIAENETSAEVKRAAAYATVFLWRNSETGSKTPCAIRVSGSNIEEQVDFFYSHLWSNIREGIKKRIGVCFGVRWQESSFLPNHPECVVVTEDASDIVPMFDLTTGEVRLANELTATDKAIAEAYAMGHLPALHEHAVECCGSEALKDSYTAIFLAKQMETIAEKGTPDQQYDRLLASCAKYEDWLSRFSPSKEAIKKVMLFAEKPVPSAWRRLIEFQKTAGSTLLDEQHLQYIYRALTHVIALPKEDVLRGEYMATLQEYVGSIKANRFDLLVTQALEKKCPVETFEEIVCCGKTLSKDALLYLVENEKKALQFETRENIQKVNHNLLCNGQLTDTGFGDFCADDFAKLLNDFSLNQADHVTLLHSILEALGEDTQQIGQIQKKTVNSESKKKINEHLWLLSLSHLKKNKQPSELDRILSSFSSEYTQDRLSSLLTVCAEMPLDLSQKEKLLAYSEECWQHGIRDENKLFMLFEKQPEKSCMLSVLKARGYRLPHELELPNWTGFRKENFVSIVKKKVQNKTLSQLVAYRKTEFEADCKLCPDGFTTEQLWTELKPVLLPELSGCEQKIEQESSLEIIREFFSEYEKGVLQNDWLGEHISQLITQKNMLYKVFCWNEKGRNISEGIGLLNELDMSQTAQAVRKSIGLYLRKSVSIYPERPTKESLICGLMANSEDAAEYWKNYFTKNAELSETANKLWEKEGLYLLHLSCWTLRTLKSLAVNKSYIQSYTRVKLLGAKKAKAQLSRGMIRKKCKLFDQTDALHELRDIISEK